LLGAVTAARGIIITLFVVVVVVVDAFCVLVVFDTLENVLNALVVVVVVRNFSAGVCAFAAIARARRAGTRALLEPTLLG
jgi:hypothetical protein